MYVCIYTHNTYTHAHMRQAGRPGQHAGMQACSMQACRHASRQAHRHTGTQADRQAYMVPRRRPRPPPTPHGVPPAPKPGLSSEQSVTRHQRNSRASCLSKGGGVGGITHNTWNHKTGNHMVEVGKDNPQHREPQGPSPFPSPSTHR